jgi:hypothetical protein
VYHAGEPFTTQGFLGRRAIASSRLVLSTNHKDAIWRFDGSRWQIWHLMKQAYNPAPFSLAFPFLAGEDLAEFVTNSETQGRKQARRAFRARVRKTKPSPA